MLLSALRHIYSGCARFFDSYRLITHSAQKNHSTPLLLLRDCYESIVVTAFFYLLLMYLSHNPEEQRRIFAKYGLSREADEEASARGDLVKKWVFPLHFVKWKPQVRVHDY